MIQKANILVPRKAKRTGTSQMRRKKQMIKKQKKIMLLVFAAELLSILIMSLFLLNGMLHREHGVRIEEEVLMAPDAIGFQEAATRVDAQSNAQEEKEILLVNRDNPLPKDYSVTLMTLPDGVNRAAEEAYEPLCDMLEAGRREGLAFEICSSYRDVKRQEELFAEDVAAYMRNGLSYKQAYDKTAEQTMPPGYSEHSSGLAFDIVSLGYQMLDEGQEDTAENQWLQEHCAEYGFILRYPKDKEDITQITYESWHFRYVGIEVATFIMEEGITLEEYLETYA